MLTEGAEHHSVHSGCCEVKECWWSINVHMELPDTVTNHVHHRCKRHQTQPHLTQFLICLDCATS